MTMALRVSAELAAKLALPPGPTRGKYRNAATVAGGIRFASRKESRRYAELKLLERAGVVSGLKLQVRYRLAINDVLICAYVCDFEYTENGARVVEDVKGFKTPEYKLKARLMLAIYGIVILET